MAENRSTSGRGFASMDDDKQRDIARKERDNNGDGRVDYWEYWEGEAVDRIGEDLDGDGQVDRWTKSPDSQGT